MGTWSVFQVQMEVPKAWGRGGGCPYKRCADPGRHPQMRGVPYKWEGERGSHLLPFPLNTDSREPWCERELDWGTWEPLEPALRIS